MLYEVITRYGLDQITHKVDSFNVKKVNAEKVEIFISTISTSPAEYEAKSITRYTVLGNGIIGVKSSVEPSDKIIYLPRVGHILQMPAGFENVEYLGAGPFENYTDRLSYNFV